MAAFRVFLIALALSAPVWALNAVPVAACSCGLDVPGMVDRSTFIVIGTPQDTAIIKTSVGTDYQALVETSVEVEEYVKGSGPSDLLLRSIAKTAKDDQGILIVIPGLGPTCGYAPELDVRHLLFITEDTVGVYYSQGCSGNLAFEPDSTFAQERVEEIRQLLQEPTPQPTVVELPETGTGSSDPDDFLGGQVAAAAAGVLLAASASVVFVVLRRRAS